MKKPDVTPEIGEQAGKPPQFFPPHVMFAPSGVSAVPGEHIPSEVVVGAGVVVVDVMHSSSEGAATVTEYFPAAQVKHVLDVVAPTAAE